MVILQCLYVAFASVWGVISILMLIELLKTNGSIDGSMSSIVLSATLLFVTCYGIYAVCQLPA